ncbi:glycosyltransferase [Clostridium perfringens]|uniref:glycosyltransferase n=2 Tax=Clostridium perfringens TaxID=1502 RepID=UPI0018E4310E|nr:glycosyltransferase family 2 protein [Clostridium perfringens]MDK0550834.1 glycosyltransferase family 2 protein [Clostridium perfringens]
MNKKISVIVPIYNVEKYLEKCINSILNQTYKNLEVILVDDGSPDNCGKICDEYALKDNRIKVIHKENGGLSSARNSGLDIATGDYIGFVDSDDWIESNMYEILLNNAIKYNADISVGGVVDLLEENDKYIKTKSTFNGTIETVCLNKQEAMKKFFLGSWSAWDKLYKRKVHEHLRFPQGKINEDEAIAMHILDNCNNIVYTNEVFYNYISRPNSITTSEFSEKKLDWYKNCKYNLEFIKEKQPQLIKYALLRFCNSIMWSLRCISLTDNNFKDSAKLLVKELKVNKKDILRNELISRKEKFWIILILLTSINNNITIFIILNRINNKINSKF